MEEDRAQTDIGLAADIEEQHREEDLEKALAEQETTETEAGSKEAPEPPTPPSPPQPQGEAPSGETDFIQNATAQATEQSTSETPGKPTLKQPKKRFIGRRAAAEAAAKTPGLSVEDSGAVGKLNILLSFI